MSGGFVRQTDGVIFPSLTDPSAVLLFLLGLGLLALKVWALIDAIRRPAEAFVAAGKQTKIIWVAILTVVVLLGGTSVLSIFALAGTVAAIVYLVDVRPAVSGRSL